METILFSFFSFFNNQVEPILGDTTIAIHPNDPRYNYPNGKLDIHPFNGRKLPILFFYNQVETILGDTTISF